MENYTSDSSSDVDNENKILDLSHLMLNMEAMNNNLNAIVDDDKTFKEIEVAVLHHNILYNLPTNLFKLRNLQTLDVSSTNLTALPDIFQYCPITTLIAKNNNLTDDSLPKSFTPSTKVRELNLSGNMLVNFPEQIFEFVNLKYLYLGSNRISIISRNIGRLKSLNILAMGGNDLREVPTIVGELKTLQALILCDNKIESLPSTIANLKQLKSLQLHKNYLRTLPPAIIKLEHLTELSLRDNPLVVRFVSDMTHNPGSLLELAARAVTIQNIHVGPEDVPETLLTYLDSGHRCVNNQCKGVYFDNRVEHIKFVDFCGKYRIPLLQFLCSSKCIEDRRVEVRLNQSHMMKKVLLG